MTYVHTWDEFVDAVRREIKQRDSTVQTMPPEHELQGYWNDYVSVEKTAQDWIDYYHS